MSIKLRKCTVERIVTDESNAAALEKQGFERVTVKEQVENETIIFEKELEDMTKEELTELAEKAGLRIITVLTKRDLVEILKAEL